MTPSVEMISVLNLSFSRGCILGSSIGSWKLPLGLLGRDGVLLLNEEKSGASTCG